MGKTCKRRVHKIRHKIRKEGQERPIPAVDVVFPRKPDKHSLLKKEQLYAI